MWPGTRFVAPVENGTHMHFGAGWRGIATGEITLMCKIWTLKIARKSAFEMPRADVPRSVVMNHMIHPHAQFGVCLRLLDVPVPCADGPSADDKPGFGVWEKSGRPPKACPSHHFPVFITMSILPLK